MREKLTEALFGAGGLLRVRPSLAWGLLGLVWYLALEGKISADDVFKGFLVVVSYYFATRGSQGS